MAHENVAVIRDHYAATNERDFARAMAHYDVDVELLAPPAYRSVSFARQFSPASNTHWRRLR
jgi:hypothetical protein